MAIISGDRWPRHFSERTVISHGRRNTMKTTRVTFHKFSVGDSDEPYLYAAPPLHEWLQTEKGRWCQEHSEGELVLTSYADHVTYGYMFCVVGELSDTNLTYYRLRWQD